MWRKPTDAKPSSDAASSISPRTQAETRPKRSSFDRSPAASPVYSPAETISSQASRIGPGLKIKGDITGNDDLYLDGEATGKILLTGARLTIGLKGHVQAEIEAREIVVNGSLQGNLKAEDHLRLGSSSQVEGTLSAPSVGIDDGARFRGKVEVTRATPAPVAAPLAASVEESASEPELLKPVGANAEGE